MFTSRFLIFVTIIFFQFSCSFNKVDKVHGISNLKNKIEKIKINKSNKNDVTNILGPSVLIDQNEERWTYFEVRETKNKFGKKIIYENNYVEIKYDKYGLVKEKIIFDLKNMKEIKFSKDKTETYALNESFIKGILSSTRKRLKNTRDKYNSD